MNTPHPDPTPTVPEETKVEVNVKSNKNMGLKIRSRKVLPDWPTGLVVHCIVGCLISILCVLLSKLTLKQSYLQNMGYYWWPLVISFFGVTTTIHYQVFKKNAWAAVSYSLVIINLTILFLFAAVDNSIIIYSLYPILVSVLISDLLHYGLNRKQRSGSEMLFRVYAILSTILIWTWLIQFKSGLGFPWFFYPILFGAFLLTLKKMKSKGKAAWAFVKVITGYTIANLTITWLFTSTSFIAVVAIPSLSLVGFVYIIKSICSCSTDKEKEVQDREELITPTETETETETETKVEPQLTPQALVPQLPKESISREEVPIPKVPE